MNPGLARHKATIFRDEMRETGTGGEVKYQSQLITLFMDIKPISSSKYISADQERRDSTHTVMIRNPRAIRVSENDYLVDHRNRKYLILSVIELKHGADLELVCKEVKND